MGVVVGGRGGLVLPAVCASVADLGCYGLLVGEGASEGRGNVDYGDVEGAGWAFCFGCETVVEIALGGAASFVRGGVGCGCCGHVFWFHVLLESKNECLVGNRCVICSRSRERITIGVIRSLRVAGGRCRIPISSVTKYRRTVQLTYVCLTQRQNLSYYSVSTEVMGGF